MRKLMVLIAAASLLAGCAQGVWVRPGATQAEAALTFDQCGYEATLNTPDTEVRLGGRHTLGKALAEGLIEGIAEGVRQGNLKSLCMRAHGFQQVPVAVATALVNGPAATPLLRADVFATPLPAPLPQVRMAMATAPPPFAVTAVPQARIQPIMALQGAFEAYSPTPAPRPLMTLPTGATVRHAFLMGACSAGDVTACIVTEAERPARPSLY